MPIPILGSRQIPVLVPDSAESIQWSRSALCWTKLCNVTIYLYSKCLFLHCVLYVYIYHHIGQHIRRYQYIFDWPKRPIKISEPISRSFLTPSRFFLMSTKNQNIPLLTSQGHYMFLIHILLTSYWVRDSVSFAFDNNYVPDFAFSIRISHTVMLCSCSYCTLSTTLL